MVDDPKRRPSASSKRARFDTRAEPNSPALPEPEEWVSRGRPSVRTKPAVEGRGVRIGPGPIEQAARQAQSQRPASEPGGDPSALRRQVAALQQELTATQHRLAATQEERIDEADRLSEMLTRVTQLETGKLLHEEALAKASASTAAASGGASSEAMAEVERRAATHLADLLKSNELLAQEKETSAWLRAAGEQATREVAAFRARATAPALKTTDPSDTNAEELSNVRTELSKLQASFAEAIASAKKLEADLLAAQADAQQAKEASGSAAANLETAASSAVAKVVALEEELRAEKAALAAATASLEEVRATLATVQTKSAGAAKDADEQIGALASQLSSNVATLEGLRTEKEAIASVVAQATSQLTASAAATTALRAEKEVVAKELASIASELTASTAAVATARTEKTTIAKDLADANAKLAASTATTAALKGERDALAAEREVLAGRTAAAIVQLESTTGMLAILIRSHEALEAGEEQISKLRDAAQASRTAIADQTVALRLALSRGADALGPRPKGVAPKLPQPAGEAHDAPASAAKK